MLAKPKMEFTLENGVRLKCVRLGRRDCRDGCYFLKDMKCTKSQFLEDIDCFEFGVMFRESK